METRVYVLCNGKEVYVGFLTSIDIQMKQVVVYIGEGRSGYIRISDGLCEFRALHTEDWLLCRLVTEPFRELRTEE